MHEVSIILNVLDIAQQNCKKEGYSTIDSITIKIGKASGVMPDALYFAFDAVKAETNASHAILEVISIPVGGNCRSCRKDFTVDEKYIFACPLCGSDDFKVTTGRELDVVELEVS